MIYPVGLHPGATWRKCDFQIHTPRDPGWSTTPHLPGGTPELEAARDQWADEFVDACIKKGLLAIAITDHHDFCFVEYVKRAVDRLSDEGRRPWVFPGMEITCNDSAQCLVLFDVGTSENLWNRLFGGHLQNIEIPNSNDATNPTTTLCGKELAEFIKDLVNDTPLSGRCIWLPHAKSGGHKTILRLGFQERFRSLPFDGVYLDGPFSGLEVGDRKIVYGEIPAWSNRRRGVLPTGDNRRHDFSRLGEYGCWIKLGEPTVEAIRQALLADEARITYEPPVLPNQRLLRMTVKSSLTGKLDVSFNDGFTALIGGRGSGKSAILEYLRFGLGRSAADIEGIDDDIRAREKQLINATLVEGTVIVELERNGVREVWTRTGGQRELITATLGDGSVEQLTIVAAQQRFRARAFYQKQLSSIATDQGRADEQITGIAAAETVDQRQKAEQAIAAAKREISAAVQRIVEYWIIQSEHVQKTNAVLDLKRRIDAVKAKLGEGGLKPEHQVLLDEAPIQNLIGSLIQEAGSTVSKDLGSIRALRDKLPSIALADWGPVAGKEGVPEFIRAVSEAKASINNHIGSVETILRVLLSEQEEFANRFKERKEHFDSLHSAAAQQQEHLKSLIDESNRLFNELQAAESAERNAAARLTELNDAPTRLGDARNQLKAALLQRHAVLEVAAAKVEAMSGGSLKAVVRSEEVPKEYLEALISLCDGHRIRDVQTKCEERIRKAQAATVDATWESVIETSLGALRHKLQTAATSLDGTEEVGRELQGALLGALTAQQLTSLYNSLEVQKVVALASAVSESYVAFEYNDAKTYIPFSQASEGQQAAALLELLLRQDAGTLIIDQPEEDLDNRVIMHIAHLLQTTKQRRQLLFATHNPNFVVNGDADKVVVLHTGDTGAGPGVSRPRVSIEVDGAIETPPVRLAITDTIEGGREAFELRGRKYQF